MTDFERAALMRSLHLSHHQINVNVFPTSVNAFGAEYKLQSATKSIKNISRILILHCKSKRWLHWHSSHQMM
jgi:hypothetical protein